MPSLKYEELTPFEQAKLVAMRNYYYGRHVSEFEFLRALYYQQQGMYGNE